MTVLSAQTIRRLGVISPCAEATRDETGLSRGLSACGYDLTLDQDVNLPSPGSIALSWALTAVVTTSAIFYSGPWWWSLTLWGVAVVLAVASSWGGGQMFQLASTYEYFDLPPDVVGIVHDKSTLARLGLAVQNTVAEPGWRGHLTLELTNHGPRAIKLGRGQAVAQVIFHRLDEVTDLPYAGKYQDQLRGPQEAR